MKLLVLGGTVFLSFAVAEQAVRRGCTVVCAARGVSGAVPEGAELVVWDRNEPVPAQLRDRRYDAIVDVARYPSHVRSAVEAFPDCHWVFVSTISVYADQSTPAGRPGTLAEHSPVTADVDLAAEPEAYGPMKVACEQLVRDNARSATVVRPGLVGGPQDPSGRFTYWPARLGSLSPGEEVLAPGAAEDLVQVIDVRDLARWLVDCASSATTGVYDAVGPAVPLARLLADIADGVGAAPTWTWVAQAYLAAAGVRPWQGPGSIPLWLPRPEYDGMLAHDAQPALDAGLVVRPVAQTARDTLDWLRVAPSATVTGIGRERELDLLASWRARNGAARLSQGSWPRR